MSELLSISRQKHTAIVANIWRAEKAIRYIEDRQGYSTPESRAAKDALMKILKQLSVPKE